MGLLSSKHSPSKPPEVRNEHINVPFLLQPHCAAFRNMQAYIKDDTNEIVIDDLTYNKKFTISNVVDPRGELRSECELPPGLSVWL